MAVAEFHLPRSVALVGMMGAGKTTVGQRLAERLRLPFADSDDAVEKAGGDSVAEIFAHRGEAAFREREREAVARLTETSAQVIAVGGGAFADDASRRRLLERCIVVWLEADAGTLAARLAGRGDRPLLRGGDPQAKLAQLLAERVGYYAEAPIRVDARPAVETVVDLILGALAAQS